MFFNRIKGKEKKSPSTAAVAPPQPLPPPPPPSGYKPVVRTRIYERPEEFKTPLHRLMYNFEVQYIWTFLPLGDVLNGMKTTSLLRKCLLDDMFWEGRLKRELGVKDKFAKSRDFHTHFNHKEFSFTERGYIRNRPHSFRKHYQHYTVQFFDYGGKHCDLGFRAADGTREACLEGKVIYDRFNGELGTLELKEVKAKSRTIVYPVAKKMLDARIWKFEIIERGKLLCVEGLEKLKGKYFVLESDDSDESDFDDDDDW